MFTRVYIQWSLFVGCLFWTEDRWTKLLISRNMIQVRHFKEELN